MQWEDENKEKDPGNGPFFKKNWKKSWTLKWSSLKRIYALCECVLKANSHLLQRSAFSAEDCINSEIKNSYLSVEMQLSTAESVLVWMSLKIGTSWWCNYHLNLGFKSRPHKLFYYKNLLTGSCKIKYFYFASNKHGKCLRLNQCDQMTRSFFNFWPFTTVNICPIPITIVAKVGSKCCQILTNP